MKNLQYLKKFVDLHENSKSLVTLRDTINLISEENMF